MKAGKTFHQFHAAALGEPYELVSRLFNESSFGFGILDKQFRYRAVNRALAVMNNLSPQERERLSSITEELIERVLDEPAERLRNAREMRGRLGAIEALRHLFGIDRDTDKGGKGGSGE